ncbi:MAG: hypothetical protein QOJ76_2084 [Acidobacteriota bacterium]|jgi:hypothetical protein|nr:hypothetical protein [Acidobacteriota bacterium]
MYRLRLVLVFGSLLMLFTAAGRAGAQEYRTVRPEYGGFDVEVLTGGSPLEVLYGRGRRYVEAREGAEYDLIVRNPLPVRVAVALSVDGLNTIDARRTSAWEASKWVVEPYGTIRISGWQMSGRRARRFYFTSERDSYAARLGRASDLGVITAVFFREAVPRSDRGVPPPPYDEDERDGQQSRSEALARSQAPAESEMRAGNGAAKSRRSGGAVAATPRDDGYAATGIGRSVEHNVDWIQMSLERAPAAEVTVRYEYRDALVRLGLLPRPWRDDGALRRREHSRGFEEPRYSPEP